MNYKETKTILAIESSCDDSGVAVLEFDKKNNFQMIANLAASQIEIHAPYGGVVPNLAARQHQKNIPLLTEQAFKKLEKVPDFFAVTHGPGLIPALLVGVSAAKALSFYFKKPIIPVNHLKGHLAAVLDQPGVNLKNFKEIFPALVLLVSGGHTELVIFRNWQEAKIIGTTQDDAAGEAFDKVAKLLNLSYPGGPIISKLAQHGNSQAFDLPRPMIGQPNLNFSFSGLKTAVFYLVKKINKGQKISLKQQKDIAASFQRAVVETLRAKTKKAILQTNPKSLVLGGGVAANQDLRHSLEFLAKKENIEFLAPDPKNCTDNAQMIAQAAFLDLAHGVKTKKWSEISANANLSL